MRVVLFIGTLDTGGAERQSINLARGLAAQGTDVVLLTVFPGGGYWSEATHDRHIKLHSLYGRRPAWRLLRLLCVLWAPVRLRSRLASDPPDVLYSMLYLTNVFARFATIGMSRRILLVWGVRSSNMQGDYRYTLPKMLCRVLSGGVPLIISNSRRGLQFMEDDGFSLRSAAVIHNGIDTRQFEFDPAGRERQRTSWGIDPDEDLVGLVGRLTPMKGHELFLDMAALLRQNSGRFRFVLVGPGDSDSRRQLESRAEELGLADVMTFAGPATEMTSAYSAIDVIVSSSLWGEGFPNVIGEAMACRRPCVVTDVGDMAEIVGECGAVVEAGDARALADAVLSVLPKGETLGHCARQRVQSKFSIDVLVGETTRVLDTALANLRRCRAG